MEDQNLNQIEQPERLQPEQHNERSNYALILASGFMVFLVLGLLTIGYKYLSGSKNPSYTTSVGQDQEEQQATASRVVVSSNEDLEALNDEMDASDTKDLEADYEQALSEASEL